MSVDLRGTRLSVLNKGYVRLVDYMGNDLTHSNAARASFNKEATEWKDSEARLIDYLTRNVETSPFRHAVLSWEVKAPLFVCRQWWKYVVASTQVEDQNGWNEVSRRYVQDEPEFYIPDCHQWRSQPANRKQGSGETIDIFRGLDNTEKLRQHCAEGVKLYNEAMNDDNICAEEARLFLPAYAMYTTWRWTASFNATAWFLAQRLGHQAQREIFEYAVAVYAITRQVFPYTTTRLLRSLIPNT